MKHKTLRNMVLAAIFSALIAIGAFIRIPIPVVPFTLQLEFVVLAGMLLGGKWGAASVGIYAALGLAGVPIFTEGGGIGYLFKPTFGYILGFILAAYLIGAISHKVERPSLPRLLAANYAGLAVIYAVGMVYFYCVRNFYLAVPMDIKSLFLYCFLATIPADIVLCGLSAVLGKRLIPLVQKHLG